jgi:hypothetical protein
MLIFFEENTFFHEGFGVSKDELRSRGNSIHKRLSRGGERNLLRVQILLPKNGKSNQRRMIGGSRWLGSNQRAHELKNEDGLHKRLAWNPKDRKATLTEKKKRTKKLVKQVDR